MSGSTRESAQRYVDSHGYLSWLDVRVTSLEDGRAVLTIPDEGKFRNVREHGDGPVHGGIVATLIDTASAFALRTTFEDPENAKLTTTDLNVSYLEPATGALRATADVVRAGGSMGVVEVAVGEAPDDGSNGEEPTGRDVARGRTSYRLFRD